MAVWKRLLPVQGRPTEVWGIDEVGKAAALVHIVIIAGNPGAAGYYAAFLQALHARFDQRARVWAVSSLGFHTLRNQHDHELPTYTLREQCAHKASFLREHCLSAHSMPPVILMGHSIGAYMAIKAVHLLEADEADQASCGRTHPPLSHRIVRIVGLFPFFQTSPINPKQRVLRMLCQYPGVIAGIAHVLEHVPGVVRRYIVSIFGANLDATSLATTDALVRWDAVRNAFTLAACEFEDLDQEGIWDDVKRLANRLCVLGAPNDHWFPQAHYSLCETLLPASNLCWDVNQMHAFCVTQPHSRAAARAVEVWIRQALAEVAHETAHQHVHVSEAL